ncbi:MAG: hypothetical protein ACRYG8_05930 [Janthinobacterium lividum]
MRHKKVEPIALEDGLANPDLCSERSSPGHLMVLLDAADLNIPMLGPLCAMIPLDQIDWNPERSQDLRRFAAQIP